MAVIAVALMLVIAVTCLGLGVDLSRVVLLKQAQQAQIEAAALSAALALDFTEHGLARASGEADRAEAAMQYAEASQGPWHPFAADPARTRCVKVSKDLVIPLTMMRVVVQSPNLPLQTTVMACQVRPGLAEIVQ